MLTFVLQCVYSVVVAVAALLCLRVARKPSGNPHQDAAWRLTGLAFLCHATLDALQNVYGGTVFGMPIQSPEMLAYLRWVPAMHHSRTFLLTALMLSLGLLVMWRRPPDRRFWTIAWALLAAGFLVGAAIGINEGRFVTPEHFEMVAVWDVLELITVLGALFALLLSNHADRMLWGFLAAYGVGLALGVFWMTLMAMIGTPGSWQPPYWTLAAMRLIVALLMLAAVARRLWLQQHGKRVRGILEPRLGPLTSLH